MINFFRRERREKEGHLRPTGPFSPKPMKGSVPHHAENHGFAPGPGKGNKFLTLLSFSESEGGQA
jgi:hypothetical protein